MATPQRDPEELVLLYTTEVENETPRRIAFELGCSVEHLVDANIDRYPGLKANSRLKTGTVLVYEEATSDEDDDDSDDTVDTDDAIRCECGRTFDSRAGLMGHQRTACKDPHVRAESAKAVAAAQC